MKWLPKDRQNPFIIVVLITAAVLVLIYFGLISTQHGSLSKIAVNRQIRGKKTAGHGQHHQEFRLDRQAAGGV